MFSAQLLTSAAGAGRLSSEGFDKRVGDMRRLEGSGRQDGLEDRAVGG